MQALTRGLESGSSARQSNIEPLVSSSATFEYAWWASSLTGAHIDPLEWNPSLTHKYRKWNQQE